MKQIKKSISILLVLLLSISIFAVPAFAAETVQDGLKVSLVTDKDAYNDGETIEATLTVENTNSFAVYDVSLESLVPEGYVLADDAENIKNLESLAGGDSVVLTVRLLPKPDGGSDPVNPPETPTEGDSTEGTEAPTEGKPTETPDTGDKSHMGLWMILLIVSGTAITVLTLKYKIWKRTISMVLALAMVASVFAGISVNASAAQADSEAKTIHISTEVRSGNAAVQIDATVTYRLADAAKYTVRFELNYEGAPQLATQTVAQGERAVEPETPIREGYTFGYWIVDSGEGYVEFDFSVPITGDITLYAYWRQGDGTSVYFTTYHIVSFGYPDHMTDDELDSLLLPADQSVQTGSLVYGMPTPVRTGYAFAGWYYDSALTQAADAEDVVQSDTVLYPLMVETDYSADGYASNNYVADLDVSDLNHRVIVKAPSRQFVLDNLAYVDILDDGKELEINVTDNGDGTFTVTPVGGLEGGKTYQLRALDRDQFPDVEDLNNWSDGFIRFYHQGELQSLNVCYYNIFTTREEVDNLRLAGGMIPIPASEVGGLDMSQVSSLFTVRSGENGETSLDTNEMEGSFTYAGDKAISVGDVVLIYEGNGAVEEEYALSHTVSSAANTAFLKVASVDRDTYTYSMPDLYEVLFVPDVLPIPLDADTDGDTGNNTLTVADAYLDFSNLPIRSNVLDKDTVAEAEDFVALYSGSLDAPGDDVRYGKIVSVEKQNGFTTIVFETATREDIENAVDSYMYNEVPVALTQSDQITLQNEVVQQIKDSGFAEEAAAFALQEKLNMSETPVWGRSYAMTRAQAETLDVEIEYGDIDAGTYVIQFQLDPPDINANITTNLQRITTINSGNGLRVSFGIYIPVGIEVVNIITGEVDESLTMDLYVTMEQEFAVDLRVSVDADIDWWLFIPTDFIITLSAAFDIGIYSGVGAVISVDTQNGYDKSYIWDELVQEDGSNGAFTAASSLTDQMNTMLSEGNTSFFDQYKDEEGNSTLIEAYSNMLQNDVDYMDILSIPIGSSLGFRGKITPNVPVAEYLIEPTIVFSAKLNVVLGTSFEALNVKEYSFMLRLSTSDGVSAWAGVVDKETPYHSFNMMIFGNVGLRAGFRISASIGLLSVKLCNVGVMLELGFYLDLYGFGYYHYDWNAETGKNIQKAGAIYVEIGFYMDIDLFGGALLDLFTFTIHALELEVPIWSADTREYVYEMYTDNLDHLDIYESDPDNDSNFILNSECYYVKTFDIVSGETAIKKTDIGTVTVVVPAAYSSYVDAQEIIDPSTYKSKHIIVVNPYHRTNSAAARSNVSSASTEFTLTLYYEESVNASGGVLNSLYDFIGPLSDTVTVSWTCEKLDFDIMMATEAEIDYVYGYPRLNTGNYQKIKTLKENDTIKLGNLDHMAPQLEGMIFVGWQIRCYNDTEWDGKIIQSTSELDGCPMPFDDIRLIPLYTGDQVEYRIRHFIPSLADPEEYDVFQEELLTGTALTYAATGWDYLDMFLTNVEGVTTDWSQIEFLGIAEYQFPAIRSYLIYPDGSTTIDLYYTRDSYNVTLYVNNTDYQYTGNEKGTRTMTVQYGEAVVDPGYSTADIPGYKFVGWSTTKDGSSGITETLPDSFDASNYIKDRNGSYSFYAIWEPETVECQLHYYLLDANGEYQYQGTEQRQLSYGTKLYGDHLEPTSVVLPENSYLDLAEAFIVSDGITQAYTRNYIYYAEGDHVIHVYYALDYTLLNFDGELSYAERDTDIILPALEKEGYVFQGWRSAWDADALYPAGESFTLEHSQYYFTSVFTEADDVKYTVEHYLQETDGTYAETPYETQVLFGTTGSSVSPAVNTYSGFVSPSVKTGTVAPDGSLVISYYYKRQTYSVSLDYAVEGEDLILRGRYTSSYTYGVPFFLTDLTNDPITIAREGYQLTGWYLADETLNPDKTVLNPNNYLVEGDALYCEKELVFKPAWEKIPCEYRVEHYLQQLDGTYALQQSDVSTAYIHDTITAQSAQFGGFTFNETAEGTVLSGTITTVSEVPVLKLYYTRNSYDAKWYDYDGVTLLTTTTFKYGEAVTAPGVAASRSGYTFGGWSIDGETMPIGGTAFNAKDHGDWTANTYTVEFDPNGGTGTMNPQSFTYDVTQGLTANSFERAGYVFTGWSLTADGQAAFADQQQVSNLATSGSMTLYAMWTAGTATAYAVQYYGETVDGNGYELLETKNYTGGTDTQATAAATDIAGFTFDETNIGNITSGTISGDGSLVLKLYYTRNSYTLTLDFDGENLKQAKRREDSSLMDVVGFDVADQTVTLKYGQPLANALSDITVNMMIQEGYWNWDVEQQTNVWVDPVYEDIAFETAFPGYQFDSWEGITDTMPAKDLTLTAQWTPIELTVTFYSGSEFNSDITGDTFEMTCTYGQSITIPEHGFVYDGRTITGWGFGNGDGGVGNYPVIFESTIELVYGYYEQFSGGSTINLSPYWATNGNLLTVQFNGNEASGSMEEYVMDGSNGAYLIRNKFTREGYTFAGWKTEQTATEANYTDGEYISSPDTITLPGTIVLYAHWEKDAE